MLKRVLWFCFRLKGESAQLFMKIQKGINCFFIGFQQEYINKARSP